MALNKLHLENFTVFDSVEIEFSDGINVLIGENGTGKTHLLKLLYSFYESDTLAQNSKLPLFQTLSKCFLVEELSALFHQAQSPMKVSIEVNEKKYLYEVLFSNKIPQPEPEDLMDIEISLDQTDPLLENIDISFQIDGQRSRASVKSAFIPAKEMLTHAGLEKDYVERYIPFDETLVDILFKSGVSELRTLSPMAQNTLNAIKEIIGGTVLFEKDRYYILHDDQKISFQSEAEGFKKISVLWRLLETGCIEKGSILFWDEPEANLNPRNIPKLADMLYALQESGVQIVLATHDYVLAKYLEIKRKNAGKIRFHSLYKQQGQMKVESNPLFKDLQNNSIAEAYNKLLDEVFEQTIKG